MAGRYGYKGVGLQTVDDKNRVALPSGLRVLVERNIGEAASTKDGRVITITTHETDPCLMVYDEALYDQLMLEVEERARLNSGPDGMINDDIMRRGLGIPENANFDPNGRFILPGYQKEHAGITRHAFFFGRGKAIEIWDPRTLMHFERATPALKSACDYHCQRMKVEW